jgi:centromere/kinetochore protein ZW10
LKVIVSNQQVVLEVLDAKLVSIQNRWRSGGLQRCGLASREVAHLVHALFEDTDLKREVLRDLLSAP